MAEFGFGKQKRLLKPVEFQHVFDKANLRASTKNFLLIAAPNKLQHARIGFILARKNVRLAVQRNRIKRITREYFRHHCGDIPPLDIIVLARKGFDRLNNDDINTGLDSAWQKLTYKMQNKRGNNA